jgi:hypothetical protein
MESEFSPCGRRCLSEAKADEGWQPNEALRPLTRLAPNGAIHPLPQGERGRDADAGHIYGTA